MREQDEPINQSTQYEYQEKSNGKRQVILEVHVLVATRRFFEYHSFDSNGHLLVVQSLK
jgi:hypothetical protein